MTDGHRFPIVGIGASAGGIPAMEGFFRGLPSGTGMAFVIVTHLSPERKSLLHEVVARYTDMPVMVAQEGMAIEADDVYVMLENAILTVEKGRLRLRHPTVLGRERKPVDIFFTALAQDQGDYAVGVILSGGDSDGTLGVKAIKQRGGLAVAQVGDGSGPSNPSMPESAISTGLIDIAVPAEQMGEKLTQFARGFGALEGLAEAGERQAGLDLGGARLRSITARRVAGRRPGWNLERDGVRSNHVVPTRADHVRA